MEYNYNLIPQKKKKNGLAVFSICLAAIALICSVAVTVTARDSAEKDYDDSISQIESDYGDRLREMEETIKQLEAKLAAYSISNPQASPNLTNTSLADISPSSLISAVAEKVKPSIVNITVSVPSTKYQSGFFTYSVGGYSSSGTGIVLSEDGYISTNYHVVEYFDSYENVSIIVKLYDGTEAEAAIVGGDETNDIAVLKIDPTGLNLIPAALGSSDALQVGEIVIAIGNPLGEQFAGTVTMGIISALDRNLSSENTAETLIQTDAARNPGNSGGALINTNGEVIGITTLKVSDTTVEGLGFAIPISYAQPIISDLIEYGYVKDRPATGITGQTMSATYARWYNVPEGLYIVSVDKDSGADLAGLQSGDIITEIDGVAVYSMSDIQSVNNAHKIGDVISVTYYRNREYHTTNLILMEDRGR